jgi:hypothetical protein
MSFALDIVKQHCLRYRSEFLSGLTVASFFGFGRLAGSSLFFHPMSIRIRIKFQKAPALYANAGNRFEAEATEAAARRLMTVYGIDALRMTDKSLYSHHNFADNALLAKLRTEQRSTTLLLVFFG